MRRPTWLAIAAAAATLGLDAQAQTAPRYTARDLTKPTSALYCGAPASLNERGDAHQTCTYKVGSYTSTGKVCMDYLPICYPVTSTTQVTKTMPAVWPAGSAAKVLDVTPLSSTWGSVILFSGEVLARGSAMTTKGFSTGPQQAWRWLPPYASTGQLLARPAALQGLDAEMQGATQGGTQWWRSLDARQNYLVSPEGVLAREPAAPLPFGAGESVEEDLVWAIQDGDQTLHGRWVRLPADNTFRYELWYRQGQQWLRIPSTEVLGGHFAPLDFLKA